MKALFFCVPAAKSMFVHRRQNQCFILHVHKNAITYHYHISHLSKSKGTLLHTIGRKTRQPPSAAHKAAAPQSSSGRGAAAGRNAYGAVGWCNVVPEVPFTAIYRNASVFPLCCVPFSSPEPPYAVSRHRAARGRNTYCKYRFQTDSGGFAAVCLERKRRRLAKL